MNDLIIKCIISPAVHRPEWAPAANEAFSINNSLITLISSIKCRHTGKLSAGD